MDPKDQPPVVASIEHTRQFFGLWMLVNKIHLNESTEDDIVWKHMTNGHYSAHSAYKVQFPSMTFSPLDHMVWKAWAPPKVKFFAWLAIQNRIWTIDRLSKRGWTNCGLCPLCKQVQECGTHLFFKCHYTSRVWRLVTEKLRLGDLSITSWHLEGSI